MEILKLFFKVSNQQSSLDLFPLTEKLFKRTFIDTISVLVLLNLGSRTNMLARYRSTFSA